MTAIQCKVPDQVEQAFNALFADQDKDAIIADLALRYITRLSGFLQNSPKP